MTPPESPSADAVAIVGLACRFPGARTPAAFWENLKTGTESLRFFTDDELRAAGVRDELLANPRYVKSAGGTLTDIDLFDAAFFGFDEADAALLDPQHRFFLECAHEALENAGIAPDSFDGAIGVFGGVGGPHYLLHNIARNPRVWHGAGRLAVSVSNEKDFLPLRTSYLLNLRGPSIGVQTACSTSLVAVHLACQSLVGGECDIALAGGSSISALRPEGYLHDEGGVYSHDGHCRAFDAQASGMVGGDGTGLVVLRRLEDALDDGDTIHAVIRGTAVNNDGSGKVGFIAPGVGSQRQVIREALDVADVDARTIGYVEAHGTGTPLGDMIEVAALTDAFRSDTDDCGYCGIGSVKTNIGHLNTAAGAAALIKTVLALEHRTLPATLHFEQPNPEIDFAATPFAVVTAGRDWPEGDAQTPRRACVHAMAIGGTNAHVVLEEAPAPADRAPCADEHLLLVSARTESALQTACAQLGEHLAGHPDLHLGDVALTLQVGRQPLPHRCAVVASSVAEAAQALQADDAPAATPGRGDRQVAFVFTSATAAATRPAAGALTAELYGEHASLRETIDQCAAALKPHLGIDLLDVLLRGAAPDDAAARAAGFALETGLARLWQSLGVQPGAVGGTGRGELSAAVVAGVLSLDDALGILSGGAASATPHAPTPHAPTPHAPTIHAPTIPLASAHAGAWITPALKRDVAHWQAALAAEDAGRNALARCLSDRPRVELTIDAAATPASRRDVLQQLADLWLAGAAVDWRQLRSGQSQAHRRIPLPTYPFERRRYWVEPTDDDSLDQLLADEQVAPAASAVTTGPDSAEYAAPESTIEKSIAGVWCDVLGIERVGIHDNFFAVGGRSLTGIKVMTRLREELTVELALRQLFEAPTIAELAKLVELARWDTTGGGEGDDDAGDREEIEL